MKVQNVNIKNSEKIEVKEDTVFVLELSDEKLDCDLEFLFEKEGVTAQVNGAFRLNKGQKLNLTTNSIHKVPNTSCNVVIKEVLEDKAESNYIGKILIDKKAPKTTSFLEHKVLVIGEGTKTTSEPILEIETDDVKASHGATTGRISEEQIYYLMSRGLDKNESVDMIVEGFLRI